jgi:Flp pilus assembly pilin Flp
MLYRLSYVRAPVILARDCGGFGPRRQWEREERGVRPAGEGGGGMQAFSNPRREEGQTMTEYAVVLAVITPAIIGAFALLSDGFINRLATVIGFLS